MTKLVDFLDSDRARWARFRMADGAPCWLGIAQTGILVKQSRIGLWGTKLYEEKDVEKVFQLMLALDMKFPKDMTPSGLWSPALRLPANAILHCGTVDEVHTTLESAGSG